MSKATILLADNDDEFRATRCEALEQEGYKVVPARNPEEAKDILNRGGIDVAVIDVRLINDNDEKDLSGLNLAKRVAPSIPKIILTKFPTVEAVREALAPQLEGLPPAIDFVAKQEGPQVLLTAIRKVLNLGGRFRELSGSIVDRIAEDYKDARHQAKVNFGASVVMAILGTVVVFIGVALVMGNLLALGIPSVIVGIVVEVVSVLFFKRVDIANTRMDRYHQELLKTRQFENLLAACEELTNNESREKSKEKVIIAATKLWLCQSGMGLQTSTEKNNEALPKEL